MKVEKRSGNIVEFEKDKIIKAVKKAFNAVKTNISEDDINNLMDFINENLPEDVKRVEDIQDKIVLWLHKNNYHNEGIAFTKYRERRAIARDTSFNSVNLVNEYLCQLDDMAVHENSSTMYSLQGLNNHIFSSVSEKYWLSLYSDEIKNAYNSGRMHLHDLQSISAYCSGWDLKSLLLEGFGGVAGKPSSKPPKHLSSALNQANNFIFTVQGEFAGAIAFSNFNTLLAPFVREDDLSYNQVKQEIQQFIYNLNISTRVGFQCLSEDTEILSENGWVGYNDLKVGDKIITFNIETHNLEEKVVINMFKERYDGIMINLKNKITDQLITPNHRIIMKSFKENKYDFKLAENILEYKSDICLPISSKGTTSNLSFDINRIKFLAWFISEGTVDFNGRGNPRISIYQSNKKYLNEIKNLCDELELKYDEYFSTSGVGNGCNRIRFNSESFTKIISWFGDEILYKNIPRFIFKLSIECIETFIETYIKADGSVGEKYNRIRIYTNNENIRDALCEMLVLIGKSFTIKIRKSVPIQNYGGIKNIYVINVLKRKHAWITSKDKINYSGIVWCPTTENGTVIARRNGKCFITGNSPFSNLTLDLDTTKVKFADEPAIVGGELKDYSYGDCNKEATWISQAVVEVLSEGDAEGAMLSYPIVTFNVTKEFPWQNKLGKTILDATSKYGCFYFSNYINSDYSESDITSMCCRLKIDRREIQKHLGEYTGGLSETEYDKTHQKGHGFFGASPNTGCYDEQTEVLTKDGWKFWKDVTHKDIFITMNMKNKNIEYQEPTQLFDYEYVGDMVEIKNKNFDLLVTPNHNMLINVNKGTYKLMSAEDMVGRYQTLIPKQADWVGEDIDFFELDEITFKKSFYGNKYEETKESIKIKTTEWAEFMGWFLSEGSFDNENIAQSHGYRVFITQVKEQNKKIIESLLNKMPFNWSQDGAKYIICNKQLWMYVKQFGKAHDKFIPEFIKSLSKKYLKIFYDAIMLGDGHTKKDGQQFYYTCSSKLRDDMQEIILKLGLSSNVYERTRTDVKKIKGRIINSDKQYEINVLRSENYKIRKLSVNKKKYSGKVYCAEVPNHTLYVRRNGKTTWCGNSIGVTTLNIPAIMHDAKENGGDWDEFLTLVKHYMDLAMEFLMKKRKIVEEKMELGLYPYARHYLREVKKRTGHYYTQHFSTICPNGVHEALYIYGFKDGIMCEDGLNKAIELLKFMNEYTVVLQKEHKVLVNLEQAPAESAGVKMCKKSGIDPFGNGYYTNSTWQPAEAKIDLVDLIEMQGKLNVYYSGGSSMHTYTDSDLVPVAQDLHKIIMFAFTETKIPYMTISPVFTVCPKCGRIAGKHDICPKCGSKKTEIYERIVGYYRPHTNWNKGRLKESEKRNYLKFDKK